MSLFTGGKKHVYFISYIYDGGYGNATMTLDKPLAADGFIEIEQRMAQAAPQPLTGCKIMSIWKFER